MKGIVILGSTGSIGENALRIVSDFPERFAVRALAARSNAVRVLEQAVQYGVQVVALSDPAAAERARRIAPAGIRVLGGAGGVAELAAGEADLVVCAIVGMDALHPVLAAIESGTDIALATKEVLVAAGALTCRLAEEKGVRLLPIDSEHSAIFQCLQDTRSLPWCIRRGAGADAARIEERIERLYLTASGGPFAGRPDIDFESVTPEEALDHPRWRMGPKVTIDSATMMNKGLEVMEARWLFSVPVEKISVLVHPRSIVHSLVEFTDGAQLAQLGEPDMRTAIQYAMTWPERPENSALPRLDLVKAGSLDFSAPDPERFPCLRLAYEAAAAGGALPVALNAANEVAVASFLEKKISFAHIVRVVSRVLEETPSGACATLDEILAADARARVAAREFIAE